LREVGLDESASIRNLHLSLVFAGECVRATSAR
jgi:hypothetical protein